jgi:hypothetical protein
MSSRLIRWGGRAAVLGGILFAAVFALINLMIYGLKVLRAHFSSPTPSPTSWTRPCFCSSPREP